MDKIQQLQTQIDLLQTEINNLKSSGNFPYNTEQAIRTRLRTDTFSTQKIYASAKSASSENQAVNEGGSASYNVLTVPDAFEQYTRSDGTLAYIPIFTSL